MGEFREPDSRCWYARRVLVGKRKITTARRRLEGGCIGSLCGRPCKKRSPTFVGVGFFFMKRQAFPLCIVFHPTRPSQCEVESFRDRRIFNVQWFFRFAIR